MIASGGDVLLVGSTDGLARYNGTNWQIISTDDGLPSGNVTALHAIGTSVLIGTDSGMAVFNGLTVDRLTTSESGLPVGEIEAI